MQRPRATMEESTGGNHTTTLAARADVSADMEPDWSRVDNLDVDSDDEHVDERRINTLSAVAGGGRKPKVAKPKRKGPGLNVPLDKFIKDNPTVVGDELARPRPHRAGGKHKQNHTWCSKVGFFMKAPMPYCCFCKMPGHTLYNCSRLRAKYNKWKVCEASIEG